MSTITGTFSYEGKNDHDWYEGTIDGTECSTKVEAIGKKMAALDGHEVTAELKVQQKGKYTNRYVESIERADGEAVEVKEEKESALPRAEKADGSPDWDLKGLHMTRCALWRAFIGGDACQSLIALTLKDKPDIAQSDLAHNLLAIGRNLVRGAEVDIYHRDPASKDEDIPF